MKSLEALFEDATVEEWGIEEDEVEGDAATEKWYRRRQRSPYP